MVLTACVSLLFKKISAFFKEPPLLSTWTIRILFGVGGTSYNTFMIEALNDLRPKSVAFKLKR